MSVLSNVKSTARGALNVIQSLTKRSEFISLLNIDSGWGAVENLGTSWGGLIDVEVL
jgi:hypothetical protein